MDLVLRINIDTSHDRKLYDSFPQFLLQKGIIKDSSFDSEEVSLEKKVIWECILKYWKANKKNLLSKDEDESTEHNVERFNLHSSLSTDASSSIPVLPRKTFSSEEKERLLAKINNSYFEAGIICDADQYFEALIKEHHSMDTPLTILSDITNHNIDNDHVLEGVLHILSNYEYSDISPIGITIVLAATVNHSPVVQDLLIACFESWDSAEGIDILEKLNLDIPWLSQYRDEVVAQLRASSQSA